jgi:cell division protein FtsB
MILKRLFGFFSIAFILLVIFLPGYTKLQEIRDNNHDLEVKINTLKQENIVLEREIKRLASDPLYQEKIIREKMGLVRKGEIPVKLITED